MNGTRPAVDHISTSAYQPWAELWRCDEDGEQHQRCRLLRMRFGFPPPLQQNFREITTQNVNQLTVVSFVPVPPPCSINSCFSLSDARFPFF